MKRAVPLILAGFTGLGGCASHDYQDQYLLGGAMDHNIALQSVRDPALADNRPVEHGAGAGLVKTEAGTVKPYCGRPGCLCGARTPAGVGCGGCQRL